MNRNSVPGLANKVLAGVADRVLCAFPGALKRATLTGNPVRPEIAEITAPENRYAERSGPLRVLVVGGSLGARAAQRRRPPRPCTHYRQPRPLVTHQSGAQHVDSLRKAYSAAGVSAKTPAFIEDMRSPYAVWRECLCRWSRRVADRLVAESRPPPVYDR